MYLCLYLCIYVYVHANRTTTVLHMGKSHNDVDEEEEEEKRNIKEHSTMTLQPSIEPTNFTLSKYEIVYARFLNQLTWIRFG